MLLPRWWPDRNCGGRKMERGAGTLRVAHRVCAAQHPLCTRDTATLSIYIYFQAFLMLNCTPCVRITVSCTPWVRATPTGCTGHTATLSICDANFEAFLVQVCNKSVEICSANQCAMIEIKHSEHSQHRYMCSTIQQLLKISKAGRSPEDHPPSPLLPPPVAVSSASPTDFGQDQDQIK